MPKAFEFFSMKLFSFSSVFRSAFFPAKANALPPHGSKYASSEETPAF